MIQLSNLNKALFLFPLIIFSCNDDNVNYAACSPSQILDSCGECYYSDDDPEFNSCLDECEIQYGENICDLEGILNGDCDCSGCKEYGSPNYCDDCLISDPCSCYYDQLHSIFPIHINATVSCNEHTTISECNQHQSECEWIAGIGCSNNDADINDGSYSFDKNNLTFKIRQRCGVLLNINSNYFLQSLENIHFRDPCGETINIEYFDDQGTNSDINDGCDLPINTIYVNFMGNDLCEEIENENSCNTTEGCHWQAGMGCGDDNTYNILYNSSDDILDFEFSIYNYCENVNVGFCESTQGCNYTEDGCILDSYNYIYGGDAQNSNFNFDSDFIDNDLFIFGEKCNSSSNPDCEVIPDDSDYINDILFYNNDITNSIYLKWPGVISDTEYLEILPLGVFTIAHNNWCNDNLGSLLIENDSLTINPTSVIEGYFYNNNDYVKFGDLEINLDFKSMIELEGLAPEYCP